MAAFVDHYEVLGCDPAASPAELKRAYHEKLREYHPDKRPESRGETGARGLSMKKVNLNGKSLYVALDVLYILLLPSACKVTQAVLDAWSILQDADKRKAYDAVWHKTRNEELAAAVAEARRREGNELYKEAQALAKASGPDSLSAATAALSKYQAAIEKYSEGIDLAPTDHRIRSNRALCYSALKDWQKCKEDAAAVIEMRPDFMKGWFLLVKAFWKEGNPVTAQRQLELGLQAIPDSSELLALQEELAPEVQAACNGDLLPPVPKGRSSRNVSPSCTPVQGNSRSGSRVATPPPVRGASKSSGRQRSTSRSRYPSAGAGAWEDTARFGEEAERTAQFGSYMAGHCSSSPMPPPSPPPPPREGGSTPPPPPISQRTKGSSLASMAASSRLGVHGT
ncbi:unnamed protein product [Durusdinium trenchii]|uniref:J domain-containing protein n=2 Tax=Durusdinium trenchii TaxID=1381693 RepID=A0ABP0PMA1_9DINO